MSLYDNVQTATELVNIIQINGLSTKLEDICRAQDIFGRAELSELKSLANDIGRNNEKGEPAPKGNWSSSRQGTQSTFYFILFHIWNWEEACRFWNTYTNPQTDQIKQSNEKIKRLNAELATYKDKVAEADKALVNQGSLLREYEESLNTVKDLAEKREQEIEKLKARLYDLICTDTYKDGGNNEN